MIDLKHYSNLMEAARLDLAILEHLKNIEEHKKRVSFVSEQKKQREELLSKVEKELTSFKAGLMAHENELDQVIKANERSQKNASNITSAQQMKAIEVERTTLSKKKEMLEHEIFGLMEKIENGQKTISDAQSFLSGLKTTIPEISKEVAEATALEEKEIVNYQKRIYALVEECSSELKYLFTNLNKKYRFKNPLAMIENFHCNRCFIRIPHEEIAHLDKGIAVKTCSGCGRIFIPFAVANNQIT